MASSGSNGNDVSGDGEDAAADGVIKGVIAALGPQWNRKQLRWVGKGTDNLVGSLDYIQ